MDQRSLLIVVCIISISLLSACSTIGTDYYQLPPVEDGVSGTSGNYSSPVKALMKTADTQISQQEYVSALATMERAIRIEPRNPYLWQKMATIRLKQGQYSQAEELAMKTSSFSEDNHALIAENWRIIARARKSSGDTKGAEAALLEARKLSNEK